MRRMWLGVQVLGAGLLVLAGCNSGPDKYKPALPPEKLAMPPRDDNRFDQPIKYPANVLNKDNPNKNDGPDGPPPPTRSPSRAASGGAPY